MNNERQEQQKIHACPPVSLQHISVQV